METLRYEKPADLRFDEDDMLACPNPACDGYVIEVDQSVRRNPVGRDGDGRIGAFLQEIHFEHVGYVCSESGQTVTLPEQTDRDMLAH